MQAQTLQIARHTGAPNCVYGDVVIVFDIIGTLLNPQVLTPLIRRATNHKLNAKEYFDQVTTYAMADTLSGQFRSFEVIAGSVLEMNAEARGIEISQKDLLRLNKALHRLPPFHEVKGALQDLHTRGIRLAALSNGSASMLEEQLHRAGLTKFFEQIISAGAAERHKPAREPYLTAVDRLGGGPHELLMVAAHPWDLLGAARVGLRTALIRRPGIAPYPAAPAPNYDATDLQDFIQQLLGLEEPEKRGVNGWLLAGCGLALGVAGSLAAIRTTTPVPVTSRSRKPPLRDSIC